MRPQPRYECPLHDPHHRLGLTAQDHQDYSAGWRSYCAGGAAPTVHAQGLMFAAGFYEAQEAAE